MVQSAREALWMDTPTKTKACMQDTQFIAQSAWPTYCVCPAQPSRHKPVQEASNKALGMEPVKTGTAQTWFPRLDIQTRDLKTHLHGPSCLTPVLRCQSTGLLC